MCLLIGPILNVMKRHELDRVHNGYKFCMMRDLNGYVGDRVKDLIKLVHLRFLMKMEAHKYTQVLVL